MDTKKLRQKILDLAIHGKLVPQDPSDEPASVLLERIKTEKERLIKEGKIKKNKKSTKASDTPHYENVPFEVPESWVWTTFGNVCKKLTDGSHNPPPKRSNGYTVISAQNIKNGKIVFTDKDRYSDELGFQKENPRTQITNGDIILGIIGGSIGNVAIFDLSVPVIAQRSISIIDTYVSNIYCFYLLQSTIFQSLFLEKSIGNAQAGVYLGELDKLYIPLPPLSEQQRIVAEIKKWFALIDQIEQGKVDMQTIIKQTKSKILDLAIHGKLVPQDPNDEPAIELLKRINPGFTPCDNGHYPFEIPNVWQWCTINDISEVITGSTPSKNNIEYYGGNFPFFKPTDLDTGRHVMKASEYLTEKGKSVSRIIPPKSIAICCIGSIGKTGYIEVEGTTNQQINTIVPKKNLLNSVYGYYTCISDYFVNKLINSSSAITISIINKSKLQSVIFPLPPLAEQQRIVQKIEELFSVLDNIQKALEV